MTAQQISLVQQSWEKIKPEIQATGETFYAKLFEKAPQIRHLFQENVSSQAGRLGYMLTYIVGRLDKLDTITDDIQRLAVRHNRYGAEPEHYAIVGECLIATLEEKLGSAWNKSLKQAWSAAYKILADAMIQAQQQTEEKRA